MLSSVDTVGVHYSATLWRWYRNWVGNKEAITVKYGGRWYRVSSKARHLVLFMSADARE